MDFGFPNPILALLYCASEFLLGNLLFLLPLVHFPIMSEFCQEQIVYLWRLLSVFCFPTCGEGSFLSLGKVILLNWKAVSPGTSPKGFFRQIPEEAWICSSEACCLPSSEDPEIVLCHGSLQPWLLITFTLPMSSSLFWGTSCSKATCSCHFRYHLSRWLLRISKMEIWESHQIPILFLKPTLWFQKYILTGPIVLSRVMTCVHCLSSHLCALPRWVLLHFTFLISTWRQ